MKHDKYELCAWCEERPNAVVLCQDSPIEGEPTIHHRICNKCMVQAQIASTPYYKRTKNWYYHVNNTLREYGLNPLIGDVYLPIKQEFDDFPSLYTVKPEDWAKLPYGVFGCEDCLHNGIFCYPCLSFLRSVYRTKAYRPLHILRVKMGLSWHDMGMWVKSNTDWPIPPKIVYGELVWSDMIPKPKEEPLLLAPPLEQAHISTNYRQLSLIV